MLKLLHKTHVSIITILRLNKKKISKTEKLCVRVRGGVKGTADHVTVPIL